MPCSFQEFVKPLCGRVPKPAMKPAEFCRSQEAGVFCKGFGDEGFEAFLPNEEWMTESSNYGDRSCRSHEGVRDVIVVHF